MHSLDVRDKDALHGQYFVLALEQARSVEGRTSPNPPVGAVLVKDGSVISLGATEPPPGRHAECVAIARAGEAAQGADLYVTLEPCTFHGKTPPCTEAIVSAGIKRVFFVARDSDPRMGERASDVLARAGIYVEQIACFKEEVADLIAPFRCRVAGGRPLVSVKYAMTLDGRIATATGESKWISCGASRQWVHGLRDRVDAIMVGIGTVLKDDPELNTRLDSASRPMQSPLRVILDTHGRIPHAARVLNPDLPSRTIIAASAADAARLEKFETEKIKIERFSIGPDGRVSLSEVLSYLAEIGVNHLLCEGGSTLLGSMAQENCIDEVYAFVAPKVFGGENAPGPLGGLGCAGLADAAEFCIRSVERSDKDVLIHAVRADSAWWSDTV